MKVPEEIRKVKRHRLILLLKTLAEMVLKGILYVNGVRLNTYRGKILSRIMGKLSDISSILSLFQLITKLRQRQNLRCYPTVL